MAMQWLRTGIRRLEQCMSFPGLSVERVLNGLKYMYECAYDVSFTVCMSRNTLTCFMRLFYLEESCNTYSLLSHGMLNASSTKHSLQCCSHFTSLVAYRPSPSSFYQQTIWLITIIPPAYYGIYLSSHSLVVIPTLEISDSCPTSCEPDQ
jgi:hypothetical protein